MVASKPNVIRPDLQNVTDKTLPPQRCGDKQL